MKKLAIAMMLGIASNVCLRPGELQDASGLQPARHENV